MNLISTTTDRAVSGGKREELAIVHRIVIRLTPGVDYQKLSAALKVLKNKVSSIIWKGN